MPQIKQKAVLQVIFLPEYLRISSVWSHHTHTIHTSLSYVSGDSVIVYPGNAEATSLSLCPSVLNTEVKTCMQTDQCTSKHNEAQ